MKKTAAVMLALILSLGIFGGLAIAKSQPVNEPSKKVVMKYPNNIYTNPEYLGGFPPFKMK